MDLAASTVKHERRILAGAAIACILASVGSVSGWLPASLILLLLCVATAALLWVLARAPLASASAPAEAAPPAPLTSTTPDLARATPDLLWQIDFGSRTVTPLNAVTLEGHPSVASSGARLPDLLPARVTRHYLEALIALQSGNSSQTFEYRLGDDQPGSNQQVFEVRLTALGNREGLAIIRNITALKATEEALFSQQLFVNQIIDTSPNLIFVRDRHGRFLLVNRATQNTLGHELLVQSHMALPEHDLPLAQGDDLVLSDSQTIRLQEHCVLPNGKRFWFDVIKQPLVRDNEVYVLGIAVDITHIKLAAEGRDGYGLCSEVANALPQPFLLVRDEHIEFANLAACLLLDTPPGGVIGQPILRFARQLAPLMQADDYEGCDFELPDGLAHRGWSCRVGDSRLLIFDHKVDTATA
ncbi:PAS domain-containing protein [Chitinibacteraceae bacterium HSL-7]